MDNAGDIFMASNITTTWHTKHVDIRYQYVNENVEDGVIMIIFVKFAIIHTKNLSAELHEKHSKKIMSEKPYDIASFKNI